MNTIMQGSSGEDVRRWQTIIGVAADGEFGPDTTAATIKWQRKHDLSADGVVGPDTWTAAIGSTVAVQIADVVAPYAVALAPQVAAAGPVVGQAISISASQRPVIREGSTGEYVQQWQSVIGVAADGKFSPATRAATIAWQKARGLDADGVVGPETWAVALGEATGAFPSNAVPTVNPDSPTVGSPTGRPTIKLGSKGKDVADWQSIIGAPADGDFGPITEAQTRAWQQSHMLTPDGVVGPVTWATAAAAQVLAQAAPRPVDGGYISPIPGVTVPSTTVVSATPAAGQTLSTAKKAIDWKLPVGIAGGLVVIGGLAHLASLLKGRK